MMNDDALSPPPETLVSIAAASDALTRFLRESYWIVGFKVPPGFPDSFAGFHAVEKLGALEAAMNPKRIPYGVNGRRAVGVSGWPDMMRLATALQWLFSLKDGLIELWSLHPLCEGKGANIVSDGVELIGASQERREKWEKSVIRVAKGWPPKVSEDVVEAMETATSQICRFLWWHQSERMGSPNKHPDETMNDSLPSKWRSGNEARDKWIYGECCKGTAYDTIALKLKKKPKSWGRIESKQGIRTAAQRYAERHGLPEIPRRQQK